MRACDASRVRSARSGAGPGTRAPCRCRSVSRVTSEPLVRRERPAAAATAVALLLLPGRATAENDPYPSLDFLDPGGRLLAVTLRAPLSLPPGASHWYAVHRIGYPHPDTF